MRLVFFGTGLFAVPSLRALAGCCEVVRVVSQPDRPAGRGRKMVATAVRQAADRLGLGGVVMAPEDVNAVEVVEGLRLLGADLGVVVAYGQKIGSAVRGCFVHGCVNLHGSVLPKLRGAGPVQWTILNGETQAGVSVFSLVDAMDAGPVLLTERTAVLAGERSDELHDRLAELGAGALVRAVELIGTGAAVFVEQDASGVTRARKLKRSDSSVDPGETAELVDRKVRGLWPWPGAVLDFCCGERVERLTVARSEVFSGSGAVAEQIAAACVGALVLGEYVRCGEGALRLVEVQPAGRRVMRWKEYCNGRQIGPGTAGEFRRVEEV